MKPTPPIASQRSRLIALVVIAGCGGSTPKIAGPDAGVETGGAGSPSRTAQLVLSPQDGMTGLGTRDITLGLVDPAGSPDDAQLGAIAAQVFLETWPDRAPVSFTTAIGVADGPDASVTEKLVHVSPSTPLAGPWFVFGVRALPAGVSFWPPLADGTLGARFGHGARPRVRQLQFCEKEGAGMKLVVVFSEPFDLGGERPEQIVKVELGGATTDCTSYDQRSDGLYFVCPALTADARVVVTIPPNVYNTAGTILEPGTWSIDVGSLTAGSCRVFGTPIP